MKICAREECAVPFVSKKHNQRYCSTECCKEVTNKRIMAAYYEEKARKSGKERMCRVCNTTKLSRYNAGKICQSCLANQKTVERNSLLELIGA